MANCTDCGKSISKRSKARCQDCCNKVAYRSPEARARLSALMREQRQDEWFNAAMLQGMRDRREGLC